LWRAGPRPPRRILRWVECARRPFLFFLFFVPRRHCRARCQPLQRDLFHRGTAWRPLPPRLPPITSKYNASTPLTSDRKGISYFATISYRAPPQDEMQSHTYIRKFKKEAGGKRRMSDDLSDSIRFLSHEFTIGRVMF
jgi:hypothetical protein